ncbi:MAG: hypothetical protein AB7V58_00550 [Solirubrobacterales bacterium]
MTPLTGKVDRGDHRVRVLEEAIVELRGDLPAAASGLTETVNRAFGFGFGGHGGREEVLDRTTAEALRLVGDVYGSETVAEVRRRAA